VSEEKEERDPPNENLPINEKLLNDEDIRLKNNFAIDTSYI
jgi:hypothetical protein